MEVAGLEGGLKALTQSVAQLQSAQAERRQALESLAAKKKKIETLTQDAVSVNTVP